MMMKTGVACNDWYAPNPEWVYAAPAKEYTDLFGDVFDDVDDVYVNVEEGIVVTSENANKLVQNIKTPFAYPLLAGGYWKGVFLLCFN